MLDVVLLQNLGYRYHHREVLWRTLVVVLHRQNGARALARAGLIKGRDEAVATLERVMAWSPAPWCEEVF